MDTTETTPEELAPKWMRIARAYESIGVVEVPGLDANPLIQMFFMYTQLKGRAAARSDETPWCSAAACACMEQAGVKSPRHALARRWENWGLELDRPVYGCVAVLWTGTPDSRQGHVGFYVGTLANGDLVLLGGNQRNQLIERSYAGERLLSFRWPNPLT